MKLVKTFNLRVRISQNGILWENSTFILISGLPYGEQFGFGFIRVIYNVRVSRHVFQFSKNSLISLIDYFWFSTRSTYSGFAYCFDFRRWLIWKSRWLVCLNKNLDKDKIFPTPPSPIFDFLRSDFFSVKIKKWKGNFSPSYRVRSGMNTGIL